MSISLASALLNPTSDVFRSLGLSLLSPRSIIGSSSEESPLLTIDQDVDSFFEMAWRRIFGGGAARLGLIARL